jgi:hypothetical protein
MEFAEEFPVPDITLELPVFKTKFSKPAASE